MSHYRYLLPTLLFNLLHNGVQSDTGIIDLSLDFQVGNLTNPGAMLIEEKIVPYVPETRRLLVIDHGKVVANYVRKLEDNPNLPVNPNLPYSTFSVQKGIDNLMFGLAIEDGNLTLHDTLADVFPDESLWADIPEADYKKSVTIYELLTMTSGLVRNFTLANCCADPLNLFTPNNCPQCQDSGGNNLKEALSRVKVGATRGEWYYLDATNIYEYIIKARTGMKPRELMATKVFPELGIDDKSVGWRQTSDGIETLTAGMYLTASQIAKFGQLMLQRGMSAPEKSVISSKWVEDTVSKQVDVVDYSEPYGLRWYGFWWYTYNGCTVGNDQVGEYHCAFGLSGQAVCFSPELQRVFVRQSDCLPTGCVNNPKFFDVLLFDPSTSFEAENKSSKSSKKMKTKQSKARCMLQ